MVPVWWFLTTVPRASLDFPTFPSSPHRLERLSRANVILLDDLVTAWESFDDMRINPLLDIVQGEDVKVEFEELVEVHVEKGGESFDSWENLLFWTERIRTSPLDTFLLILTNRSYPTLTDDQGIYIHPEKSIIIVTNASQQPSYRAPQQFLETLFGRLFARIVSNKKGDLTIPDSSSYQITFTLLLGQSSASSSRAKKVTWNIVEASKKHFLPLIERLGHVADFKVHYQRRPHARLPNVKVERIEDGTSVIAQDQLAVFVDENGWNLGSSLSESTPIHFLIFVPPEEMQPMKVQLNDQLLHGFGYRQWGATFILNHPGDAPISEAELSPALAFFDAQLKSLFGLESTKQTSANGLGYYELVSLKSRLIIDRVTSTINTMEALQRLLAQNAELPIQRTIRSLVDRSSTSLQNVSSSLSQGNWDAALHAATLARQFIDAAFFHPTMMAHQYFPQEHKLGVYMPLFFPFILPTAIAALGYAVSYLKGRFRPKSS